MLSMRDCLDYCDLTEEEVALFAEYEHLSAGVAATIACGLVQSAEGVEAFSCCLSELALRALQSGELDKAQQVVRVYEHFRVTHPVEDPFFGG